MSPPNYSGGPLASTAEDRSMQPMVAPCEHSRSNLRRTISSGRPLRLNMIHLQLGGFPLRLKRSRSWNTAMGWIKHSGGPLATTAEDRSMQTVVRTARMPPNITKILKTRSTNQTYLKSVTKKPQIQKNTLRNSRCIACNLKKSSKKYQKI